MNALNYIVSKFDLMGIRRMLSSKILTAKVYHMLDTKLVSTNFKGLISY